jgi:hypothetical protein
MEKLCQGSRVVRQCSLRRLSCLFGTALSADLLSISSRREYVDDVGLPLVDRCLSSSRKKGFQTSASFKSKFSVRALIRSVEMESPDPSEFACYQCTEMR